MQRGRTEGYMVDQGAQAKQGEARTQWGCRRRDIPEEWRALRFLASYFERADVENAMVERVAWQATAGRKVIVTRPEAAIGSARWSSKRVGRLVQVCKRVFGSLQPGRVKWSLGDATRGGAQQVL